MKYITIEQLIAEKVQLEQEREQRMKELSIAYENAIAIVDKLIQIAIDDPEDIERMS